MEENKKNNKVGIIVTIIVAVVCIMACVATAVIVLITNNIKDKKEMTLLNNQVNKISTIGYSNNKVYLEKITNEMKPTITTGKRQLVEKALESYTIDLYTEIDKTINLLSDERLTGLVAADNIKKDGKDFIESKAYIMKTRLAINNNKDALNKLLKEENIMEYIEKEDVPLKYKEMYKTLAIGSNGLPENDIKELNKLIDKSIKILNISEEALNLLSQNKDKWNLTNNQVMFKEQQLLDKYNAIVNKEI